jgi:DNA replication protein DnaC
LRYRALEGEDVDYQNPRGLDRARFLKLAASGWDDERRNISITGAAGLGKSWLACVLGHKAFRENISVLYVRAPRLFADLAVAHGSRGYAWLLRTLARVKLLILDDWGPEGLKPTRRATCLKSSRTATTKARSSSPARFLSTAGAT